MVGYLLAATLIYYGIEAIVTKTFYLTSAGWSGNNAVEAGMFFVLFGVCFAVYWYYVCKKKKNSNK